MQSFLESFLVRGLEEDKRDGGRYIQGDAETQPFGV